jgi:hypothetical protein
MSAAAEHEFHIAAQQLGGQIRRLPGNDGVLTGGEQVNRHLGI